MNKKTSRYHPKIIINEEEPEISQRLLQNIQQKLEKSAALNGGFDNLIYKIDSIENNQNIISKKVDKIHDAIYHPDEGLFARINANKSQNQEYLVKVEKDIEDLSSWKNQFEKNSEKSQDDSDKIADRISTVEEVVQDLKKFREMTLGATKWLMAAVGGGVITIVFKVLYDFVILK